MNENRDNVYCAVAEYRLSDAIGYCRAMIGTYGTRYTPELDELQELYRTLLSYYISGIEDDRREHTLSYLSQSILRIADDIAREQLTHDSGALYYGRLRYRMGFAVSTIAETLSSIREVESDRKQYDQLIGSLFDILWTATELSAQDMALLNAASPYIQSVAISAVGMALQERWHISFVRYLASTLARTEATYPLVARAAIGLVLAIDAWPVRARLAAADIRLILDAAVEVRSIEPLLMSVITRLCAALDTESLTRKMQTEIIPDLQSLSEQVNKLRSIGEVGESTDINTMRPDWMKDIDQTGLEDKLRTISELQEQGADVMHSTFMNLKGDQFFRDIHSWFLPFDPAHSRVASVFADSPQLLPIARMLNSQLCDSDCYSLMLSIEMMPSNIRMQALSSMGVNTEAITEEVKDLSQSIQSQQSDQRYYAEVKNYIESLYRFYHIYRYRSDFRQIFAQPPATELPVLEDYMTDTSATMRVADMLLAQGRYHAAIARISPHVGSTCTDPILYEKVGYAYACGGQYEEALRMYRRADILTDGSSSVWTLKQIAICLRRLGRTQEACDTYLRCIELKPEELNIILLAASCMMELCQYPLARALYAKYETLTGRRSLRTMRPLAWCYFLEHMFAEAQELYKNLVSSPQTTPSDCLNAGHNALAQGQVTEAIALYQRAAQLSDSGMSFVQEGLTSDAEAIDAAGIDVAARGLISDAIRLRLQSANEGNLQQGS